MRIFNYPLVGLCMMALLGSANAQELSYKDAPQDGGLLLTGSLNFWGGFAAMDLDNNSAQDSINDTGRWGIEGRFNVPVTPSVSAQLDIDFEHDMRQETSAAARDYQALWQTGLHLSHRVPGAYLLGVFGGIGAVTINNQAPEVSYLIGVEGQYSIANTTLYGQVGYFDITDVKDTDGETMRDSWFLRGEGRHFFSPNQALSMSLIYGMGDTTSNNEAATGRSSDIDYLGWELKYQQKRDDSPFSWHVGYDGHYMEHNDRFNTETLVEHVFKVGINFSLGDDSETLKDNNDRGATLSMPTEPLRAAGYSADILD